MQTWKAPKSENLIEYNSLGDPKKTKHKNKRNGTPTTHQENDTNCNLVGS